MNLEEAQFGADLGMQLAADFITVKWSSREILSAIRFRFGHANSVIWISLLKPDLWVGWHVQVGNDHPWMITII